MAAIGSALPVGEGVGGDAHARAFAGISRAQHRYAFAVDEIDRAMLLDTFLPEAVVEATVAHGAPVPRLEGAGAIADFILSGRRAQQDKRRHIVTNLWLDALTPRSAMAHSYHLIVVAGAPGMELRSMGAYRDDMVLCADGAWRIAVKRVMLDAPY